MMSYYPYLIPMLYAPHGRASKHTKHHHNKFHVKHSNFLGTKPLITAIMLTSVLSFTVRWSPEKYGPKRSMST